MPHLRVKKMTRIKECGTKATTRKTNETESINLPTRFSKKPVSASKANLANGKLSVLNVNRSVPRKPACPGRAGKPFEGLDQIYTKSPEEPSREPHNTTVTILDEPACEQSNTESTSLPKGSEKPVKTEIPGPWLAEVPGPRFTLDWWKVYLDSCATYHSFFVKKFLRGIYTSKTIINGSCNARTVATRKKGWFGEFEVWYNNYGMAHLLSNAL